MPSALSFPSFLQGTITTISWVNMSMLLHNQNAKKVSRLGNRRSEKNFMGLY
jgi:hypothetical protein